MKPLLAILLATTLLSCKKKIEEQVGQGQVCHGGLPQRRRHRKRYTRHSSHERHLGGQHQPGDHYGFIQQCPRSTSQIKWHLADHRSQCELCESCSNGYCWHQYPRIKKKITVIQWLKPHSFTDHDPFAECLLPFCIAQEIETGAKVLSRKFCIPQ